MRRGSTIETALQQAAAAGPLVTIRPLGSSRSLRLERRLPLSPKLKEQLRLERRRRQGAWPWYVELGAWMWLAAALGVLWWATYGG